MKTVNAIIKLVTAVVTVAGAIFLLATYGDKIVEWCRKTLAACPCKWATGKDAAPVAEEPTEAAPAPEAPAAEEPAPAEEAPAAEESAAEEPAPAAEEPAEEAPADNAPVADEADFAE